MIAAEELGLPLDRVEVQIGDSARGPFASISGGSSTLPSMGPAVRSAAADAARQVLELAAQRFEREERTLSLARRARSSARDGGSWPLEEITGLLDDGQILGKGARGPNPTGMRVLTFGIQLAEVAVDVGTGEVVVETRRRDPRRRPRDQPARRPQPDRGRDHPGARPHVLGGAPRRPATGTVLTKTLDAYKLPTIADVPEIVCELVDEPDEHLTNLGSKGLGEPPIVPTAAAIANAIRDATGADVTSLPITPRGDPARAPRGRRATAREGEGWSCTGLRRVEEAVAALGDGSVALAGGTEVVPLLRDGILRADRLVRRRGRRPAWHLGPTRSERARRWPSSRRATPSRPPFGRRAAWPPRPSSGTWARSAATCSRRRAAGTGGSSSRAGCTAATRCHAQEGQHREHAFFANGFCASAHPSDPAAALLALGARIRTDRRELDLAELYRLPTEDDRATTTLEPGELILELDVPEPEASVYLKAMDRKRWAFALVGVAAARVGGETRIALAGAAPIPWLLESPATLDGATPLAGTAYKVEIARTLVQRALTRPLATIRVLMPLRLLILAALVLALAACGGDDDARARVRTDNDGSRRRPSAAAPRSSAPRGQARRRSDGARRSRSTRRRRTSSSSRRTAATFTIRLDPEKAPKTAASLVALAEAGFFDGTTFHRVVPGFVIQGGDPTGTGTGGPGYQTVDAPPQTAAYTRGVVAMAKAAAEPPGRPAASSSSSPAPTPACRPTTRSSARSPRGSTRRLGDRGARQTATGRRRSRS